MKKKTLFFMFFLIVNFSFSQKIKVKKTEIKINETIIGKAIILKKTEKYDFQDINGNHLFFGSYFTKQVKGADDKVNYIEIKINENDDPTSFNAVTELNEISLATFSFDNSREIVSQLFKKGFVTEESGFDMVKITEFTNLKEKADLVKSSVIERLPTDIGTNSKSDGTGIKIDVIQNIIQEPAIFTIGNEEYNGFTTIIFSPLTKADEEKLEHVNTNVVSYVKNIKEIDFGRRAMVSYVDLDKNGNNRENFPIVNSRRGFNITVKMNNGNIYKFASYLYDDNNLVNEGLGVLKMVTKNTANANLQTGRQEQVVFFSVVSEFEEIMILHDPVSNTIAVKIPSEKGAMSLNDMFVGSYLPKNLKKYLKCKVLDDDIEALKSITDLQNLLRKYQEECK
ncbi:hypothetical protein [Flavobacterium sp.]